MLELGAGVGNLAGRLMGKRERYVAAENDPLYLDALRNRFLRTPNVEIRDIDPDTPAGWGGLEGSVASALCINVLEYANDPAGLLRRLHCALAPGGTLVALVPQGRSLFGSVDRSLKLKRRFDGDEIRKLLQDAGFTVRQSYELNKISKPGWWLNSRVFGRSQVPRLSLKLFDKTVWLWRRLNPLLPWRGLSLVIVAERTG